ncbi:hypothetical protein CJP46_31905 [Paenibacillus sp. XY044]|nr:hypothetical protein CJP46_31905 [Paenibacillus sp. XY044]
MGTAPFFWNVVRFGDGLTGIINLTRYADIQINEQHSKCILQESTRKKVIPYIYLESCIR